MSKKDRDEALARVGRALYGELWIGDVSKREWEDGGGGHPSGAVVNLSVKPKPAAREARARFRCHAANIQNGQVIRWFHQQDIECDPRKFDHKGFEIWFAKAFGGELSATQRRRAATNKLLKAGKSPGRGGNIGWKQFCKDVNSGCKGRWNEKTIRRDAREMRALDK